MITLLSKPAVSRIVGGHEVVPDFVTGIRIDDILYIGG